LLFGLDGLNDGSRDAGDDTGAPDAGAGGDGVAVDTSDADADATADAAAVDATGAGEAGPGNDAADGRTPEAAAPDAAPTDARASSDGSTTVDADASTTSDAGPITDAETGTDGGPLAMGLVLHLPFDETSGTVAHDTSGNGNDAMLMAGATFAPGYIGNAATLAGAGQYVALTQRLTQGLTAFSVALWVHVNPAPDAALANWSRLFDLGTGTTTYAFLVPDNGSNGNLRFAITTNGNQNEERIESPNPLPTGTWEYVAVTSAQGVGTLYVNGAQVAQTSGMTLTLASLGATTQNWLGRSQFPVDPYLAAQIDELRLYSRALLSGEVALLYAQH
jgi:hypothetical protein